MPVEHKTKVVSHGNGPKIVVRAYQDGWALAKIPIRYIASVSNIESPFALHQQGDDLRRCCDIANRDEGILRSYEVFSVEFGAWGQQNVELQPHLFCFAQWVLLMIGLAVSGRKLVDSVAAQIEEDSVGAIQHWRPKLVKGPLIGGREESKSSPRKESRH